MVLGSHVIFSAYGFWLPNDPRGSWSDFVGAWELRRFGPATKTTERRSVAHRDHDQRLRLAAKNALKLPAVHFTGAQALAIATGFRTYIRKSGLIVWACSILPEHVHLVVARFRTTVEQMVIQLKGEATQQLIRDNLHPFSNKVHPNGRAPKCWVRGEWKVFLDSTEAIVRSIEYVRQNPIKEGKPAQEWSFVIPFDPASVQFV
jgi:REP element-mobilizing transposase RayT